VARRAAKQFDPNPIYAEGQRPDLQARWEAVWQGLSVPARALFLRMLPGTGYGLSYYHSLPLRKSKAPPGVLEELTAAGLVEALLGRGKKETEELVVPASAQAFVIRLVGLHMFHFLSATDMHQLNYYCSETFVYNLMHVQLQRILTRAGQKEPYYGYHLLNNHVLQHYWVEWVLDFLDNPLARQLVERVLQSTDPVTMAELLALSDAPADKVREALSALRVCLVLFEDLGPKTHEIVLGLLPIVRRKLERYREPRQRPELRAGLTPAEQGPAGSTLLDDLRAFLVELAAQPARLKQGGDLYQREADRLFDALPELPEWLTEFLRGETGIDAAWRWARRLRLVERHREEGTDWLRLAGPGRELLRSSLADQYRALFEAHRRTPRRQGGYDEYAYEVASKRFLGSDLLVSGEKQERGHGGTMSDAEEEAQRQRWYGTLELLPAGSFCDLESFVGHAVFKEHNPLIPDPRPARLRVVMSHKVIPDVLEQLEEAAR
jgi:hypothetical protein